MAFEAKPELCKLGAEEGDYLLRAENAQLLAEWVSHIRDFAKFVDTSPKYLAPSLLSCIMSYYYVRLLLLLHSDLLLLFSSVAASRLPEVYQTLVLP